MVKVVEKWMDFLIGVFLFVGLRRSLGLVGTGGVGSDGRKSHDRADSLTGSHGAQWPGTAGATGDLSRKRKGPLVGMYARQVDARCLSRPSVVVTGYLA